jgi:hypothetical protein
MRRLHPYLFHSGRYRLAAIRSTLLRASASSKSVQ